MTPAATNDSVPEFDSPNAMHAPVDLAGAYAELQRLLLGAADVTTLLDHLAGLAALTLTTPHVPISCGITLAQGKETHTWPAATTLPARSTRSSTATGRDLACRR